MAGDGAVGTADITARAEAVLARCRQLGVQPAQLRRLTGYGRLLTEGAELSDCGSRRRRWVLPASLALLVAVLLQQQLYTVAGLSRLLFKLEGISEHAEQCTIEMPPMMADLTTAPVNCSMCADIDRVDRVSNITPEEFEQKYAYSGRPVVVTDGTANWTAPRVFNFNFFKKLYGPSSPVIESTDNRGCQFFPYKTNFRSLREVFSMSQDRADMKPGEKPWYIGWSNCDSAAANELRRHYSRPYFLPDTSESSRLDWIFMGTPGFGAHMHIDHVRNPSWQAQLHGQKLWTLQPPPECQSVCRRMETTVNPGEIIVLDTNIWYHMTTIVSDVISITIGSEYD
ncbi:uncharacterized protein LOC122379903 [Amphibalanus amphitrite]|uniref:uncharacterized protein LOC122379903 n=1 Tax=Amphibalanus amphitrite TaxID=1232801 RepID=UPI001C900971|nr:uncharacterized protein LOC122379903 [Amphibalanus amphitrite]